jgi:hypothetical protein
MVFDTSSSKNLTKVERNQSGKTEAMVDMIMKRMKQVFMPPQRLQRCEACGGDHPTLQCIPKKIDQPPKPPRTDKWCEFEQKWTNHETTECHHRIQFMREQGFAQVPTATPQGENYMPRVGNQNYVAPRMERAQSVLGNQLSLPGVALVRFVQPEDLELDGTLVLVSYYGGENSDNAMNPTPSSIGSIGPSVVIPEGSYQMDHNTLWFIANGGARQ